MIQFTAIQEEQLIRLGSSKAQIETQISRFKTGFKSIKLIRPAVIGDGILQIPKKDEQQFVNLFEEQKDNLGITKFIPASGAASRMFKFLHEFVMAYNPANESLNAYINNNKAQELFTFFIAIEKFPFYHNINTALRKDHSEWDNLPDRDRKLWFVKKMLYEKPFCYCDIPKGLVPFHKYKDHEATAFEEHLFEATIFAQSQGVARLHFTISPEYIDAFNQEINRIENIVTLKTNTRFDIDFSHQLSSTDTVAVTLDNEIVTTPEGLLHMRPAGHGALLENLNSIDADIIFIKNIDNITVSSLEKETGRYKKVLAGYLLHIQKQVFKYLDLIDTNKISNEIQNEIVLFLKNELSCDFPKDYSKYASEYKLEYLRSKLNRPIRVCGMVRNEGEPGGGPFWIEKTNGELSLEIIESVQVDSKNKTQQKIARNGTHFNPVDIVCGVTNYKGDKFNLLDFADSEAGFITQKSYMGKKIKAQELPGLWNGGMSHWNTVFIEMPLITFNPVKTVNDLLKPAHQL